MSLKEKRISEKYGNRRKDVTGQKFGFLTAIKPIESIKGGWLWEFKCDCGNIVYKKLSELHSTKSCGCYRRRFRWKENTAETKLYQSYKKTASHKGREFSLTFDEFLKITKDSCVYCGIEPSNVIKSRTHSYTYNGIDRLDNTKGYTLDNCVPCCSTCNYSKRIMTAEQFVNWIKRAYMHNFRKCTDKTPGEVIDLLFTTDYKCWWQQEKIMDMSLSEEERLEAAEKAQEYNAKRSKLIRTFDAMFGFTENTVTEKTYSGGDIDDDGKDNYSYFDKSKKE